jgi:hypothetical protein
MMTKKIQVFAEYKIKDNDIQSYEKAMENVVQRLNEDGASNVQWYKSVDQNHLYVEMYEVDSLEDYTRIKELRKNPVEKTYKDIHAFIEGNVEKLHMWAFTSVK